MVIDEQSVRVAALNPLELELVHLLREAHQVIVTVQNSPSVLSDLSPKVNGAILKKEQVELKADFDLLALGWERVQFLELFYFLPNVPPLIYVVVRGHCHRSRPLCSDFHYLELVHLEKGH